MPRPSHLPTYREREALILLHDHGDLPLRKRHPAEQLTLAKMIDKMWVERIGSDIYRITSAGTAALKARLEMTPSEAKLRILAEWRTWIGHRQSAVSRTTEEALTFFKEIEQNKPELLAFASVDKWDFVKGWLLNAGLIKE